MKRQHLVIGAVALALIAALAAWRYLERPAPQPTAAEESASALVKTAPVARQILPLRMQVFGEVIGGKLEALGFSQAGQVEQLAVVAGQRVRRGALIATLNSDPAAQSAYAQAVSALAFGRRELRRNQELLALQLATQSQVDGAARQLADAQAGLAAQAKLGGAQATARLLAPFDAIVVATPVGQGERVAAGATIVQLGRADKVRVQLGLEPAQSTQVRAGMAVSIAALQDKARTVAAAITEVQSLVDPKTQMVSALVLLPAAKDTPLLAGMRVQAAIALGQRLAWAVPRQAVLGDDKGAYLFQVAAGKARRVEVVKLLETGQMYGVDGKLDAALPVVVLGNYELQDGMAVREGTR